MKLKKGVNFGGYLSQCVHTKEHFDGKNFGKRR